MRRSICFLALFIFLMSGCAYTAGYNKSPFIDQNALSAVVMKRPAKSPDEIQFLKSAPTRPFVVLGTLHAPQVEWTAHYDMDDLTKAMRVKAASIGADAIMGFRQQEKPTTVMSGSMSPSYGGVIAPVHFKGLHAWGEAIIFVSEKEAKKIEPGR